MENIVTILGARGSAPVSGKAYEKYGGATTCVLAELAGSFTVLDAGTGILSLPPEAMESPELTLLLSHPHADHLMGLGMCPYLHRVEGRMRIWAARRGGLDARAQAERLFSPPLWPVTPSELSANVSYHDVEPSLSFGRLTVDAMEGVHPGGVTIFRLRGGGKTVVFAIDCELTAELLPALIDFAADCDLLLIDGQYSPAEREKRSGFGHSSWAEAAALGKACRARRVRVIHHDPAHTDETLDEAAAELSAIHPDCAFAREGEEVRL